MWAKGGQRTPAPSLLPDGLTLDRHGSVAYTIGIWRCSHVTMTTMTTMLTIVQSECRFLAVALCQNATFETDIEIYS